MEKNGITIDPLICHGKPCVRGMRYPVSSILEYLAAGDTVEDILEEFTELEEDDIKACLMFAVLAASGRLFCRPTAVISAIFN